MRASTSTTTTTTESLLPTNSLLPSFDKKGVVDGTGSASSFSGATMSSDETSSLLPSSSTTRNFVGGTFPASESHDANQLSMLPPLHHNVPHDVEIVITETTDDGWNGGGDGNARNAADGRPVTTAMRNDNDEDGSSLTRQLVKRWVVKGMLAPAAITYAMAPTLHWTTLVASAFVAPVLAIVQGSLGILQFRVRFGTAPVPVAPSHGVVYARQQQQQERRDGTADESDEPPDEFEVLKGTTSTGTAIPRHVDAGTTPTIDDARHLSPVRLLVIGDSLAIGVGQRYSAFPVLPSAIAKTLSAKLGRVVYWTCHGAPGASTGWIVRELERGVSTPDDPATLMVHEFHGDNQSTSASSDKQPPSRQSSLASTSSDGSDSMSVDAAWRKRLTAHRKRFNPDKLGPYDIVVVLTGSNDLKSAFFPFLLTGEDAEFRRQAKERGGNYNKELRRLVETLYDKMKIQFQTLRESIQTGVDQMMTQVEAATESVRERVEQATESVRERVEETMERIRIPVGGTALDQLLPTFPPRKTSTANDAEPSAAVSATVPAKGEVCQVNGRGIDASSTTSTAESVPDDDIEDYESLNGVNAADVGAAEEDAQGDGDGNDDDVSVQQGHSRHYPLVVLPGMPSRALPIFGTVPLRWLACPIVDIMDRHKHDLAALHPGHVLFVPAPDLMDVQMYENRHGNLWNEKSTEDVVLNLHDPVRNPLQDANLEASMQHYYGARASWTVWKQSGLFAEDQIHPNDAGYDFWGRYIGHSIYKEWRQSQAQSQVQ